MTEFNLELGDHQILEDVPFASEPLQSWKAKRVAKIKADFLRKGFATLWEAFEK
jgi:hypothetical protein